MTDRMGESTKYIAQIEPVREVALWGTADLRFWIDAMQSQELQPAERDGQAQIVTTAVEAKWNGMRFRELSIGLVVNDPLQLVQQGGLYLAHAWNSSRLLAFCERAFFSTPYVHGQVETRLNLPAFIGARDNSGSALRAEMGTGVDRAPVCADQSWEGPIYLPRSPKWPNGQRRYFFARLAGPTEEYSFSAAADRFEVAPTQRPAVLQWLLDSGFSGRRWTIRREGVHSRSKTYKNA